MKTGGLHMRGIFLVLIVVILSCSNEYAKTKNGQEVDDYSKHYMEVCINTHIYYYRNSAHRESLSLKMSDNGLPVKCVKIKESR